MIVQPLDDFGLQNISFIKIDVEGHEVEGLKGSSKTIERWRLTILLEVKEKNTAEVNLYFSRKRYLSCFYATRSNRLARQRRERHLCAERAFREFLLNA